MESINQYVMSLVGPLIAAGPDIAKKNVFVFFLVLNFLRQPKPVS